MAQWLKQSTATTRKMGPFVSSTDGNTEQTALTIAQADIRLTKNGGAFAQSNNSAGATHDEHGYYGVPLDTTDTGTLGTLRVAIHVTGALPVWQDYLVVAANIFDSLIGGGDTLDTNVMEWDDATVATPSVSGVPVTDPHHLLGTVLTEGAAGRLAAAVIKWFNVASPTGTVNSIPDAVAGANNGLPTTNGTKVNQTVDLTAGQSIAVSDKTGFSLSTAGILAIWNQATNDVGIVAGSFAKKLADWVLGTDKKALISTDAQDLTATLSVNTKTITNGAIAAATFAANALDAVWSTATRVLTAGTNIVLAKGTGVTGFNDLDASGVRTAVGLASANLDTQLGAIPASTRDVDNTSPAAGSLGAKVNAAASAGDPWATNIPGSYIAGEAGYIVGNNLNAKVGDVKAKTDNLPASPAAVGSNMGTVTSVIGNVGGNVTGTVGGLAAQAQTDVQSALTSQGLTTTRAGYLDTLNGLVAAIWANATRTLTAISDSSGVTTLLSRVVGTLLAGNHNPQSGDAYGVVKAGGAGDGAAIKAITDQFRFTIPLQVDSNALTGGGSGLTAQQTRDAMKLAPTAGAPAGGSIDDKLNGLAPGAPIDLVVDITEIHTT